MEGDRTRVVQELWKYIRGLNSENVANYPAAARLIQEGADATDLAKAMSAAAYGATFNTLFVLTCEEDIDELAASGVARCLHEDLLTADPTGEEGSDLFH